MRYAILGIAISLIALIPYDFTITAAQESPIVVKTRAQAEDYAISRAMAHNVSVSKLTGIIRAESDFYINAKNASSTASGLAQFINGTFQWLCIDRYKLAHSMKFKNDPKIQIECLAMALSDNLESHWSSSEHVWGPSLSL